MTTDPHHPDSFFEAMREHQERAQRISGSMQAQAQLAQAAQKYLNAQSQPAKDAIEALEAKYKPVQDALKDYERQYKHVQDVINGMQIEIPNIEMHLNPEINQVNLEGILGGRFAQVDNFAYESARKNSHQNDSDHEELRTQINDFKKEVLAKLDELQKEIRER